MDEATAHQLVATARVARLGTTSATGRIDLVPITFALDIDGRLVTAVDHKPKTTPHLKRLDNIRAHPEVSVMVDHYDEDWAGLWWVRLRGLAHVVESGPLHAGAVSALVAKYPQYSQQYPAGPAIVIELIRWQWWSASASPLLPAGSEASG